MAHFAELDDNNIVLRVIVVSNNDILDENGNESEEIGISFCKNLFSGNWVQTSYNNSFRNIYAQVGGTYDPIKDIFIKIPIPPIPENIGEPTENLES